MDKQEKLYLLCKRYCLLYETGEIVKKLNGNNKQFTIKKENIMKEIEETIGD